MPLLNRIIHITMSGKTAVAASYVFVVVEFPLLIAAAIAAYFESVLVARRLAWVATILCVVFFAYLIARWPQERRERRVRQQAKGQIQN